MKTTTQTVLDYIQTRGVIPGSTMEEKLACAYLDEKIIDSMGIIELVSFFEEKYGIRFDAHDLQCPEFLTINGLISIIEKLNQSR